MKIAAFAARLIIAAAVTVAGLAATAGTASADHSFSAEAGFERSSTIRVSRTSGIDVNAVVAPWNRIAGRTLFAVVDSDPQITFRPAAVSFAQPSPAYASRYTSCTVNYAETTSFTLSHELGHCLGFADHVDVASHNAYYVNPAICDAVGNTIFSSYKGVMSYCSWQSGAAFGREDRAMLVNAGYVTVATATTTVAAPTVAPAKAPAQRLRYTWTQYRAIRAAR